MAPAPRALSAFAAAALLLARPTVAAAQHIEDPLVRRGAHVRVTLDSTRARLEGKVTSLSPDTLTINGGTRYSVPRTVAVPATSIARLEVQDGRKHLLGAVTGLAGGIVGGAIMGALLGHVLIDSRCVHWQPDLPAGQCYYYDSEKNMGAAIVGIGGAVVGGGLGLIIGAIAAPARWRDVPVTR